MSESKLSSALRNLRSIPASSAGSNATRPSVSHHLFEGVQLTDEQIAVVESGARKLKVQAYAGAGKTTTLKAFASHATGAQGLYLAFNQSIAEQAQRSFPPHIQARTTNSLALSQLLKSSPAWRDALSSKLTPQFSLPQLQELCRSKLHGAEHKTPLLSIVYDTLQAFIFSGDAFIDERHLPMDRLHLLPAAAFSACDPLRVIQLARHVWDRQIDPADPAPITHDGYLKLWSLRPAPLPYDFILIDEAQDSNAALLAGLSRQSARQIYVGDEHQGIYAFRGAVNALSHLSDCESLHLTLSHRFGAQLAHLANGLITLKGQSSSPLVRPAGPDTSISFGTAPLGQVPLLLARSNEGLFEKAFQLARQGRSIHFIGGDQRFNLEHVSDLLALLDGRVPQHPWFAAFQSLDQLVQAAHDHKNSDLIFKCRLVSDYGSDLPAAMTFIRKRATPDPTKARAFMSTVHKAKGLEFDWVELLDDFQLPEKTSPLDFFAPDFLSEANVLYVALTRARQGLCFTSEPQWSWIQSLLHLGQGKAPPSIDLSEPLAAALSRRPRHSSP